MDITQHTPRYLASPTVDVAIVDDEAVLLDRSSGVYFGLDETATMIWSLLAADLTSAQVAAQLVDGFHDADPEVVAADVARLLDELTGLGLVRVAA